MGVCQADLSPSDKNLKDINGMPQPHSDCDYNVFQGAPTSKTLRDGDILTFNINLCNLKGTADATGVLVTDKLLNLSVPLAGFSAALDNQALVFVPNGPSPGQYAYDSSTQQLYFNVGTVAKGTARQITYNVQVKTATANTGCVRCQSQTTISYFKDMASKVLQTIDLYTPPIFYSVSK